MLRPFRTMAATVRPALLACAMAAGLAAAAQTASDACVQTAANHYPVDDNCFGYIFEIPANFAYNFNPGGCGSGFQRDAFGWFTATGPYTSVQFTPDDGSDVILQVMSAANGPLMRCANGGIGGQPETVTVATTPGQDYFFRVQPATNTPVSGTVCIENRDCLYRLYLRDSGGDGWSDLYYDYHWAEIVVNGNSLYGWTMTYGGESYVEFGVNEGDPIQVNYHAVSPWYWDENSMELVSMGPCPAPEPMAAAYPAISYTSTATCSMPPFAPPEDCIGAVTVCSNATIANNSFNAGCAADITPGNSGCMDVVETQGSWYIFSPSSAGNLGLSITPDGPDDYDWAIWGPYPEGTTTADICRPAGQPIRCAASGALATLASTGSYSTGMGSPYYSSPQFAGTTTSYGLPATLDYCPLPPPYYCGWVPGIQVSAGQVYLLYISNWSGTSTGFSMNWVLGNGASLDCTVLPVELLSLKATPRANVIDLDWATATEQNSDHFTVQRSPDNETFADIGTVPAAGDAQFRTDYRFTDQAPATGANYYRLLQVDRDGATVISNSVVAFPGQGPDKRPALFPNPVQGQLQVALHSSADGSTAIRVLDAVGRTAATFERDLARGGNTITLPVDHLARGWYNVQITLPDGTPLPASCFLKR